jgi:taurine dioxygenase
MGDVIDSQNAATVFEAWPIPSSPFGFEVAVDLSANFSDAEKDALRQLYRRDGLLLFRDQKLTKAQQIMACDIFAPALPEDAIENFIVSNVREDGVLGDRELLFHNDVPFVPAPFLGGCLYALEVDEGVSTTRFANAMRGFEALPDELQGRVDGMNALHVRARAFTRRTKLSDCEPQDNCAVHALVGRQEETARPYVFACMDMTAQVIGLSEPDSDALLEELFSYLYAPENVFEHSWQQGDLVIWDNLAVQHARAEIESGRRTLQRVTMGKWGYWEQCPVDLPTFDELHEQAAE